MHTRHTVIAALLLGVAHPAAGQRATWTAAGRPTPQARALVEALSGVASRGLRPADYDAATLVAALRALDAGAPDSAAAVRFDDAITRAATRVLVHLHQGRVPPTAVGFHLADAHRAVAYPALVARLSRAADVPSFLDAIEPPYAGYRALRTALARYRALAADTTLRPPPRPPRTLHAGDPYAGAAALRRVLLALGDLAAPADVPPPDTLYDATLAEGVRAFQRRHGLDPDGALGTATLGALRVPPAARAAQIALTLERWRWLPDTAPPRFVVVNVPAFRLYAFEGDPAAARPALRMNVIVGDAGHARHTPVFVGQLREVVFRPYWEVPASIARNELVPRARRDRSYLDREALEIVDEAGRTRAATSAALARVAAGSLRLRQRPGPGNALGPVKFVFPNAYNVYLHGTPARSLFARTRRDFSHGCVRVEDPAALAEWVLSGQDGWSRASIEAAMASPATTPHRVGVARPAAVFMLYATAVVGDDGALRFYADIYGRDAALAGALGAADPRRDTAASRPE